LECDAGYEQRLIADERAVLRQLGEWEQSNINLTFDTHSDPAAEMVMMDAALGPTWKRK
jgi:hypothetical protein